MANGVPPHIPDHWRQVYDDFLKLPPVPKQRQMPTIRVQRSFPDVALHTHARTPRDREAMLRQDMLDRLRDLINEHGKYHERRKGFGGISDTIVAALDVPPEVLNGLSPPAAEVAAEADADKAARLMSVLEDRVRFLERRDDYQDDVLVAELRYVLAKMREVSE
jgi:hypothetical protein